MKSRDENKKKEAKPKQNKKEDSKVSKQEIVETKKVPKKEPIKTESKKEKTKVQKEKEKPFHNPLLRFPDHIIFRYSMVSYIQFRTVHHRCDSGAGQFALHRGRDHQHGPCFTGPQYYI